MGQPSVIVNSESGLTVRTDLNKVIAGYNTVINVKDFGAKGDGSTDDTSAIQSALDAAFGTAGSPHGNGGGPSNLPVYFPAGTYRTLSPLVITAVWGGHIFGAGELSSIIQFRGTITPVNSENVCPVLWLNECNYCTIENLSFDGVTDPTNHTTACLWFGPDGLSGRTNAHANTMVNISTTNSSFGIIHGSANSQANSENTYIGCNLSVHEQVGLYCSGPNTLNIRFIGGGIDFCGLAGIKTNNDATIPIVMSPAFDNNFTDMDFFVGGNTAISGVRTESGCFLRTNALHTVLNCHQSAAGGTCTGSTSSAAASFTGTISGGTLTVSGVTGTIYQGASVYGGGVAAKTQILYPLVGGGNLTWALNVDQTGPQTVGPVAMTAGAVLTVSGGISSSATLQPGSAIYGTDGTNSLPTNLPTRILHQLTGSQWGTGTYIISSKGSPGNLSSCTLTFRPVFSDTPGPGVISIDNSGGVADGVLVDPNGSSTLRIRNGVFKDGIHGGILSADLFKWFTGNILEYDVPGFATTVAHLPPSTASFRGVRLFVTDYNIAAGGAFNTTVIGHGSSTTTMPVWCTGSDWVIG